MDDVFRQPQKGFVDVVKEDMQGVGVTEENARNRVMVADDPL